MTRSEIVEAIAQGWCAPGVSDRRFDPALANAIADEVWRTDTRPSLGYATTRELLAELVARTETDGSADYRTVAVTVDPAPVILT